MRTRHQHAGTSWSYTGALVLNRPTQGTLTEPDGRRFHVTYASDCAEMRDGLAPKTKQPIVAAVPGGGPRPHGETPGAARRGRRCRARRRPGGGAGVVLEGKEDETQEADDDDDVPVTPEDADEDQVDDLA